MTDQPLPRAQAQLLAWLTDCADVGEPCPMNGAIAKRYNFASDSAGAKMIADLEGHGLIAVDRFLVGNRSHRVVTIVSTGQSTKRPEGPPPSVRPERSVKRPDADAPAKPDRMDRILTAARAARGPGPAPQPPVELERPTVDLVPEPSITPIAADPPIEQEEAALPPSATTPADVARSYLAATPGLKAEVEFVDGEMRLTVWLSTDRGPLREFRPFITFALDEAHATELLGSTAIALRDARKAA